MIKIFGFFLGSTSSTLDLPQGMPERTLRASLAESLKEKNAHSIRILSLALIYSLKPMHGNERNVNAQSNDPGFWNLELQQRSEFSRIQLRSIGRLGSTSGLIMRRELEAPATICNFRAKILLFHSGIAANSPKPETNLIGLPLDHLRVAIGMTQHGHSFCHCQELLGVNERIFWRHE